MISINPFRSSDLNKQGVTSLGMAVDMIKTGIDEPQVTTIDSQFVTEQHRH